MLARAELTNELEALLNSQLGNWADRHRRPSLGDSPYSSLVVKITSPPSLGSAICVFWSRKQAFICLCCYVKVARCHLFWPLQAVLRISVGVPASSLCFEELPVYGMERAQASSATQSLPRRKPFASQPRSPAEASKQASSSAQSSALAPNRKQMQLRPKFIPGSWAQNP